MLACLSSPAKAQPKPSNPTIAPVPAPPPADIAEGVPGVATDIPPEMIQPGRFQLLPAQTPANGKPIPVVLKIDTATGMVSWLQQSQSTIFMNGKPVTVTGLHFIPIAEQPMAPRPIPGVPTPPPPPPRRGF